MHRPFRERCHLSAPIWGSDRSSEVFWKAPFRPILAANIDAAVYAAVKAVGRIDSRCNSSAIVGMCRSMIVSANMTGTRIDSTYHFVCISNFQSLTHDRRVNVALAHFREPSQSMRSKCRSEILFRNQAERIFGQAYALG